MMKVLWFSNADLSNLCTCTGSWLYTMSDALTNEDGIELINITQVKGTKKIKKVKVKSSLVQYIIPVYSIHNGLPSQKHIDEIKQIVNKEKPVVIHIWGTEAYWGMLSARGYLKGNILLEMQGLISTCYRVYYGPLTIKLLLQCFSLKEVLKPTSWIPFVRARHKKRISRENEIIQNHKYISVQSSWVENYVQFIAPKAHIYHSLISVRKPFYENVWHLRNKIDRPTIVVVVSQAPYKGLFDIIQILYLLKQKVPNILLNIIGNISTQKYNIKTSGYNKLILNQIKNLDLCENVNFCGSLDAKSMVEVFLNSDVFLQASYVESYSLAVAEAMVLGMPCVVSYAGAMPELGEDGKTAYFYPCGDYVLCASRILNLLDSDEKSMKMGYNARILGLYRNSTQRAKERQISVYKKFLKEENIK